MPTYFTSTRAGCTLSPKLFCAFGALNSGDTIDIVIAYTTPSTGTAFAGTFQLNATGQTFSDGGTSHGDTYNYAFSTGLKSSPNFNGGFQLHGSQIGTTGTLGKKNDQNSTVTPPSSAEALPVTIEDGITTFPGTGDNPCLTLNCVGDWTVVQVGKDSDIGPVEVTLLIYGIKGNPSLSSFAIWHDGTIINTPCSGSTLPTGSGECLTVTAQGNNFLLDVWLNHNGTLRGLNG
jgi:hypothetical protein